MANLYKDILTPELIKLELAKQKRADSKTISASMLSTSKKVLKDDLSKSYGSATRKAAVLFTILNDNNVLKLLLTLRNKELRTHPGQISFPGGKIDKNDIDSTSCALREAKEEVGINPDSVKILGDLDECLTGSGFLVKPIVGFIKDQYHFNLNFSEVIEIYKVPLVYFLDPTKFTVSTWEGPNGIRNFYDIEWNSIRIWGATARIIVNFYEYLNKTRFS